MKGVVTALILALFLSTPGIVGADSPARFGWEPVVVGWATHYGQLFDRSERFTASGRLYDRDLNIMAVSPQLYHLYRDAWLKVTNLQTGVAWMLQVDDVCPGCGLNYVDIPDGTFADFGAEGRFLVLVEAGVVK